MLKINSKIDYIRALALSEDQLKDVDQLETTFRQLKTQLDVLLLVYSVGWSSTATCKNRTEKVVFVV